MIYLNTTFVIDHTIYDDFTNWLTEVYVRAALATNIFTDYRIAKVLTNEDPLTISIACELSAEALSEAARWHDTTAVLLRQDMSNRWPDKTLFFTTYLKSL